MILRYYLVAQYWVHQVSSACPTTPENDMECSNSGTEMTNINLNSQSWNWWYEGLQMDKQQVHPFSLLRTKSWSNKAGIMWFWDIRWHQSSGRGWFRFISTFWWLLTFIVSWYARHDISILLWCCHHPTNKAVSLVHMFSSCTFYIRIVCIITGHIAVVTHVPPM